MSRRLLLVRHGESTWNAEHRWQGRADPPLSPRGEAGARRATAPGPFDGVYASPLQRALRTAALLHGAATPVPGLEEREAGAWTGLTHAEIDARWPGARTGTWRPPGFETDAGLLDRARAAVATLTGERILVVTHEGLLRALTGTDQPIPNLAARWFERTPQGRLEPLDDGWRQL